MPDKMHEEIAELLGAYALDAVEPHERVLVEAHLAVCPRCAAEVDDHREVSAALAHGGTDAPVGLWAKIETEIRRTPAEGSPVPERVPPPDPRLPTFGTLGLTDEPDPGSNDSTGEPVTNSNVVPMRRTRKGSSRWLTAAAAVAAAVVIAVLGAQVINQRDRIDRETASGVDRLATRALTAPDSTVTSLKGEGGARTVAVIDGDGTGYVFSGTLPELPEGRSYQIWGVTGDNVVSLGVFGGDPKVVTFTADPGTQALAITDEVAGGVVTSKETPVVSGNLR